jgi:hypothetical protein
MRGRKRWTPSARRATPLSQRLRDLEAKLVVGGAHQFRRKGSFLHNEVEIDPFT